MFAAEEDRRNAGQRSRCADGADKQQRLAADAIDDRHRQHGEQKVGCSDSDRLQISGYAAESCFGEDVIQIVKDRVDSRELIEEADGYCEKNGQTVFSGEQRLIRMPVLSVDRGLSLI